MSPPESRMKITAKSPAQTRQKSREPFCSTARGILLCHPPPKTLIANSDFAWFDSLRFGQLDGQKTLIHFCVKLGRINGWIEFKNTPVICAGRFAVDRLGFQFLLLPTPDDGQLVSFHRNFQAILGHTRYFGLKHIAILGFKYVHPGQGKVLGL